MRLIFIRHGESVGNTKKGYISGRDDPEGLTTKGKSQIIRTAFELRKEHPEKIFVSPVARAQETSQIINTYCQKEVITLDWLTELHHGVLEGAFWWEVIDQIPATWRSKREDYNTAYPGGGESMKMLFERVSEGLHTLLPTLSADSTYVFLSHQAVIAALRYYFMNGGPEKINSSKQIAHFLHYIHHTKLPNGGYIVVDIEEDKPAVIQEKSELKPIKERKDNVQFYFKGIFAIPKKIQVHKFTTASSNTVYRLKNDKRYLLKILHDKDDATAWRQAELYHYLKKNGIPAPDVVYFDKSKAFYNDPVFVQDFIKGVNQGTCIEKHHETKKKLLISIYNMMEKVHSIPVEEVRAFWYPQEDKQFQSFRAFMLLNINLTLRFLYKIPFPKAKNDQVVTSIINLRNYIQKSKYRRVPLHGDMASENIITCHDREKCELVRIIDFEWARIGDPLWDYAYYWGWLESVDSDTAYEWSNIMKKKLSSKDYDLLNQYRILFHAWTMRDAVDYKGSRIRARRARESQEVLAQ